MKAATTSRPRVLDLPVHLDKAIRNQSGAVHAALRTAIIDGRLETGLQLPSSRSLAEQLGVRRNAVVAAYEHLASDGLLEARHGAGTYVAPHLPARPVAACPPALDVRPEPRRAFALGQTCVDDALLRRLASHLRRHMTMAGAEELGYGDPRGSAYLRTQIAQHLSANRGVSCDPGCILVVNGTQHALRLCVDALFARGDAVWAEDPGYYATHTTLRAAGLRLVPVPVDGEGLDVAAGRRRRVKAKAAYVTPSHQFPMGVTMSMRRRIALIDWARATQSWIIEDDYDSEFRYAGPPLTALAGLAGERVIYIGTFTKTLFAGLRLAYLVVPPAILARVIAARAAFDRFPLRFTQDAVADLMAEGLFARHIRRVRTRYKDARDAVVDVLRKEAGAALHVTEPAQGLHLVATLPHGMPVGSARTVRDHAKVEAKLLSETQLSPGGPEGLILGVSGHDLRALRDAAHRLASAAREAKSLRVMPAKAGIQYALSSSSPRAHGVLGPRFRGDDTR
ncbi:MAG: PLP-dependent aminotransferase family protein [Variibacter sp.]